MKNVSTQVAKVQVLTNCVILVVQDSYLAHDVGKDFPQLFDLLLSNDYRVVYACWLFPLASLIGGFDYFLEFG